MDYKRLEIYVGWTCNQKCIYCREYEHMEKSWHKKVSKYDILKKLIKYKKLGYNHVTFLGGEPFIQPVFLDALKIGKILGYTILVTTNCTTLHIDSQAKKFLQYIDELILSFEAIDIELQNKISRTNVYINWFNVFENIREYWKGTFLKVNIVINQDNKIELINITNYLIDKGIKNISITYPDIGDNYYTKDHIIKYIAPKYIELRESILKIINICKLKNINLKVVDFPFCIIGNKLSDFIKITDDYDYQGRLKIEDFNYEDYRDNLNYPRERKQISKCKECKYNQICWGPGKKYIELYGDDEIKTITI